MVFERYYADTQEATEKFATFRETIRECQGLTACAKTPVPLGITSVADLGVVERTTFCNIIRQTPSVPKDAPETDAPPTDQYATFPPAADAPATDLTATDEPKTDP